MEKITHEQLNEKAQEVLEKKRNPEIVEQNQNIEQLTREEEKIKQNLKKISTQDDDDDERRKVEKDRLEIKNLNNEETQLGALIKMCFTKGPNFAIKVAQGLSDNVLDSLHATLAKDEVYKQLKEKNII